MKISLHQISQQGIDVPIELQPSDQQQGLSRSDRLRQALVEPLKANLNLSKIDQNVQIKGEATTQLHAECDRCLEPFLLPLDLKLNLTCIPDHMTTDEDEGVLPYHHDTLDLTQILMSQLMASIPMNYLCKPECLGLCPSCGVDRNQEPCHCTSSTTAN